MKEYEFTLKFALKDTDYDPAEYVEHLANTGCDDALIGVGAKGRIGLQFNRKSKNAAQAIISAITDVKQAIPNAVLLEASPDFVGISDIAELLSFSRQNMQKLLRNHWMTFPAPVHEGKSAIWHLAKVLDWFKSNQQRDVDTRLVEIAEITQQINVTKEAQQVDQAVQSQLRHLLA